MPPQPFKSRGGLGSSVVISEPANAGAPASVAQRNQRYVFLIGRLRSRQMTMEEATELFALMEGMLRASEAARTALLRTPPAPPSLAAPVAPPRTALAPVGGGDDFLLLGILAMGAGAGLIAAMGKRMQDLASSPAPGSGRTVPSAAKSP